MVFDITSFLVGIVVGGLTGGLAGILYAFERTADVEESLLKLRKDVNSLDSAMTSNGSPGRMSEEKMRQLRTELDSIREDIRKMYRKNAS